MAERKKRKRRWLRRVLFGKMTFPVFFALLMVIVLTGRLIRDRLRIETSDMKLMLVSAKKQVVEMKQKQHELEAKLKIIGTDDFIATEARTKYGYLAPGEIRFKIMNPEVLWGDDPIPPEFQNRP